ncbi:cell envelope integrity EipB family protein [Methylobacterium sp. NFXW15]|uniref:cell envelope integrity EipB family protein n=1 Tax=Methylobacterium sp. NFXW15 TaxID=2819512 RepID=UPI003CF96D3C
MAASRHVLAGLLVMASPALAAPTGPEPAQTPNAQAPIVLANHRAVYDLSLSGSTGTRTVESARGRIVIDFRGDACRGYTMQTRQVTELTSGETGARLSDLRSTTFESGDGHEFRFRNTTASNGENAVPIDGTATENRDGLSVKLKGKPKPITSDGIVLFPSAHMRKLVELARAGQSTLSVKVYDGSDDGQKIYDTFAVIGQATTATTDLDKPLQTGPIAAVRRWPVKLTYYTAGVGERTPIYTLSFDLYENGVSGRIKLDYGDFALAGVMTTLDLEADKPSKDAKGCTP